MAKNTYEIEVYESILRSTVIEVEADSLMEATAKAFEKAPKVDDGDWVYEDATERWSSDYYGVAEGEEED